MGDGNKNSSSNVTQPLHAAEWATWRNTKTTPRINVNQVRVSRVYCAQLEAAKLNAEAPARKACGNLQVTLLLPGVAHDWIAANFPLDTEVSKYVENERTKTQGHELLAPIFAFRVIPVLFTQGVNEQQSLSNQLDLVGLQDEVNNAGLVKLIDYHTEFVRYHLDRLLGAVGQEDVSDANSVQMMERGQQAKGEGTC